MSLPGPPQEPKMITQCLKIESIGSIGSIVLGSFGGPGTCEAALCLRSSSSGSGCLGFGLPQKSMLHGSSDALPYL